MYVSGTALPCDFRTAHLAVDDADGDLLMIHEG